MKCGCATFRIACLISLAAHCMGAHAQEYPAKAVRIVVPFAPGGPNDLAVRPVAQKLFELLGQPFVIDYRAGANGIIGCDIVAKSAPDGYSMVVISSSFSINSMSDSSRPICFARMRRLKNGTFAAPDTLSLFLAASHSAITPRGSMVRP